MTSAFETLEIAADKRVMLALLIQEKLIRLRIIKLTK